MRKKWAVEQNNSGMKENSYLPNVLRKFNWGAALLQWIWALGNKLYFIALILFVITLISNITIHISDNILLLIINILIFIGMFFYMGFKGNELAWKNKKWDSIGHFKVVQKRWLIGSLIVYFIFIILPTIFAVTQELKKIKN